MMHDHQHLVVRVPNGDEVKGIRTSLDLTQAEFARLFGINPFTVSKWERDVLQPSPHQAALMQSFSKAVKQEPNIGSTVAALLVGAGVVAAIYFLLKAAFGSKE